MDVLGLEPCLLEHVPHSVGLMRVDDEDLGAQGAEVLEPVAQLRNLTMADRSGVAVDEDQHNRLLTAEVAQAVRLAQGIGQREIGCRLPDLGGIETGEVETAEILPYLLRKSFSLALHRESHVSACTSLFGSSAAIRSNKGLGRRSPIMPNESAA